MGELRSATFLLQLCSTILKSQRGESHPERAVPPPLPQFDGTSIPDREPEACGSAPTTSINSKCREGDRLAAQACAGLASPYLGKMIQVASVIMLEDLIKSGNDDPGGTGARHDGADAGFWVLSLLSDVLKHLKKREWRCQVSAARSSGKGGNDRDMEMDATDVPREASKASPIPAAGSVDDVINSSNARGVSDEVTPNSLGLADLVEALSAVPVGRGSGSPDVALKWLEVAQVLYNSRRKTLI